MSLTDTSDKTDARNDLRTGRKGNLLPFMPVIPRKVYRSDADISGKNPKPAGSRQKADRGQSRSASITRIDVFVRSRTNQPGSGKPRA